MSFLTKGKYKRTALRFVIPAGNRFTRRQVTHIYKLVTRREILLAQLARINRQIIRLQCK